ncbi:MAG: hypothetical protein IT458_14445 [Planctomycetes bacterium]|nr:hypothetical protein [Planctomycetota bacterium]
MLLLVTLALGACAGLGSVPEAAARAMQRAPVGRFPRILLVEGRVASLAVPVAASALPPAVAHVEEALLPGGELTFLAREWHERGTGWRVEKRLAGRGGDELRSLLLADDGAVLERSHEVQLKTAPAKVLETALAEAPGQAQRVEVLQGDPGEEWFRVTIRTPEGDRRHVECWPDGRLLRSGRVVAAEITVTR